MLNNIEKELLNEISSLHKIPQAAINIRKNGKVETRKGSKNIQITPLESGEGIKVYVSPKTKGESVHLPVIISQAGLQDAVTNEFIIGEGAEVTIVAGCGIHAGGTGKVGHEGFHTFTLFKNAKVRYIEKHIAKGTAPKREFNPQTKINLGEGAEFVMESAQLGGVTSTKRTTIVCMHENSKLDVKESILTTGNDNAESNFMVDIVGSGAGCHIVSRSVAKDNSTQKFVSLLNGGAECFGHTECDAIIMDKAKVLAEPKVNALNPNANLVHEAAIGKIAGEQILKLMTLGYTEEEAQNAIIKGFLK